MSVFKVGDKVLAKVRGFPFWPAKVTNVHNQKSVDVFFYGTGECGKISVKNVKLYGSLKEKIKTKRQSLIIAMDELEDDLAEDNDASKTVTSHVQAADSTSELKTRRKTFKLNKDQLNTPSADSDLSEDPLPAEGRIKASNVDKAHDSSNSAAQDSTSKLKKSKRKIAESAPQEDSHVPDSISELKTRRKAFKQSKEVILSSAAENESSGGLSDPNSAKGIIQDAQNSATGRSKRKLNAANQHHEPAKDAAPKEISSLVKKPEDQKRLNSGKRKIERLEGNKSEETGKIGKKFQKVEELAESSDSQVATMEPEDDLSIKNDDKSESLPAFSLAPSSRLAKRLKASRLNSVKQKVEGLESEETKNKSENLKTRRELKRMEENSARPLNSPETQHESDVLVINDEQENVSEEAVKPNPIENLKSGYTRPKKERKRQTESRLNGETSEKSEDVERELMEANYAIIEHLKFEDHDVQKVINILNQLANLDLSYEIVKKHFHIVLTIKQLTIYYGKKIKDSRLLRETATTLLNKFIAFLPQGEDPMQSFLTEVKNYQSRILKI